MGKYVFKRILRWVILLLVAAVVIFTLTFFMSRNNPAECILAKPVIYLYPEEETEVSVKIREVSLTVTYPEYAGGWNVTAYPDGTLINRADGHEYSYLFWEAESDIEFDFSEGFCVAKEDTADFLRETLSQMGLTAKEYNEFIVYWMPLMLENEYNLISFQQENYNNAAPLVISPEPDSILRVFMAWKGLDEPVEIPAQSFEPFSREGFTVVEWGGSEVK